MDRSGSSVWFPVGTVLMLIVGALAAAYIAAGFLAGRSMLHADYLELKAAVGDWNKRGRPKGTELAEFLRLQRPDLVVTNCALTIRQTTYVSQFAVTNLRGGDGGVLFATTNGLAILQSRSGKLSIVGDVKPETGRPLGARTP